MSEKPLNPQALSVQKAARLLGIPARWLTEDIDSGAPTNADGTLNLVHYAAWLNQQQKGDGHAS